MSYDRYKCANMSKLCNGGMRQHFHARMKLALCIIAAVLFSVLTAKLLLSPILPVSWLPGCFPFPFPTKISPL